jgi:hypothetical protein
MERLGLTALLPSDTVTEFEKAKRRLASVDLPTAARRVCLLAEAPADEHQGRAAKKAVMASGVRIWVGRATT